MLSYLKKFLSIVIVLWLVAWVLDLKVADKSSRQWTKDIWNSAAVQKVYTGVRDRIKALIHKDISVEEVFQSEVPKRTEAQDKLAQTKPASSPKEEVQLINTEKLDEQDREALERILQKSSQ